MSRALVVLAQRGVEAEAAARASLNATYRRFMSKAGPERKGEAGKDLIKAIFGKEMAPKPNPCVLGSNPADRAQPATAFEFRLGAAS